MANVTNTREFTMLKEEESMLKNPRFKTWDCSKDVLYLAASSLGIIIDFYSSSQLRPKQDLRKERL
jgi:hypothetical protein